MTRPAGQAQEWVRGIQSRGFEVFSLPLIDIAAMPHTEPVQALWERIAQEGDFAAVMCVSSNAVNHFFESNRAVSLLNNAQSATQFVASLSSDLLRWWATGPTTVQALRAQGVPAHAIDAPAMGAAQWDSEHLWQRVCGQLAPGKKVLIVRGLDVGTPDASRDWLAERIQNTGARVEIVQVYQRRAPVWSLEQTRMATQAVQDLSVWVFSSSQAVRHLQMLLSGLDFSKARCVVTHERIAQAARAAGFAVVYTSRPALQDVLASIESMA